MNQKVRPVFVLTLMIAGSFAFFLAGSAAQSQKATDAPKPQTAGEAHKNIQILKDMPDDQLRPTMQFIAASLGVQCDHCHVQGAFDKDDKKSKQAARKMMQMMFAINKNYFDGKREVTCNSCHNGSKKPPSVPVINAEAVITPLTPTDAANQPTAEQIVDRYVQAIGGVDAIQKVSGRVQTGAVTSLGRQFPFEIFAKAPNKRTTVMHLPDGESVTAYDGHSAWQAVPGANPRQFTGSELDAVQLDSDLYFPLHLKHAFKEMRVRGTEKAGDRDTYFVRGIREGQTPVDLYFDQQSGLLLRQVRYAQSPVGDLPTQIDYADYRDSGGVKIPYRWTTSLPGRTFSTQISDVQANAPVNDDKFSKPAAPAPQVSPP